MIKVRVGQVWKCSDEESTICNIVGDVVWWGESDFSTTKQMSKWNFIPQNDLEWLAVKVDKWNGHQYEGIIDDSLLSRVIIDNWSFTDAGHTREKWQNMRYHLGLDKKPHYRLTGGEWVKV